MRKIMLLNAKGGCGKSTLATNLAAWYARQGKNVVLADLDPQGSATEWLAARPKNAPPIRGIAGWREPLRVSSKTDYVIFDVPAGCRGAELTALVRRAQTILIPVLPSPTDIRAAAHFIHDILLVGRVVRHETRLGVIANRVPENSTLQNAGERTLVALGVNYATVNTQVYRHLERFLDRLKIPVVATLRENPYYLLADQRGLGIFEAGGWHVTRDMDQWQPLLGWLDSRRSLPTAA